ncbi:MAG: tRNA pseudouridine(38-40) synthase TruA [Anaerolineales bacterium]
MALYKSIVAYDGTDFQGFQRQAEGIRTVQLELEGALRKMGWEGTSLQAAGRTDSGVHAQGQVISYDLEWSHGEATLTKAFNAHLPKDVAVWSSELAPEGFHPRFSAARRRYRYRVVVGAWPDPLRERYALRIWPEPNLGRMADLARAFVGRMDFGAFGQAPIPGGHTVRQVNQAGWTVQADEMTFAIEADAFLKHMVRRLVAANLAVGQGLIEPEAVIALLDHPELRWEGRLADPQGLSLIAVTYDGRASRASDDD